MMSHDFESYFSLYTQQISPHNRLINIIFRENLAKKGPFLRENVAETGRFRQKKQTFKISSIQLNLTPLEHYTILASFIFT